MALYQPSNVTPSTFAGIGGGVIDVNDNVSISWQVNGNSPMTGFSIVIATNEDTPTTIHTFTESGLSFYGTNSNGVPVFYVYEPNVTWASIGMSNGEEYTMSITQNWGVSESVEQYSPSVIVTRATPSLSLSPADETTITNIENAWTGTYSQAEGDSLSWVRWVLSDSSGKVLEDTGTIYTGQLAYEYNGLFSGETYTLSCTIETENGVVVNVTNTYPVSYTMSASTGGLNVLCNEDDSVTLTWQASKNIPGVASATPYGSIADSVIHLNSSRTITWDTVDGEAMNIEPYIYDESVTPPQPISRPLLLTYKAKVRSTSTQTVTINSTDWAIWKTYPAYADTNDTLNDVVIDTPNSAKDPTIADSILVPSTTLKQEAVTQMHYRDIEYCKDNKDGTFTFTVFVPLDYPVNTTTPVVLVSYPYGSNTQMTYRLYTVQGNERLELTFTGIPTDTEAGRPIVGGTVKINYRYYTGTANYNFPPSAYMPYDLNIVSTTAYKAEMEYHSGLATYIVSVITKTSGSFSVNLQYKDVYQGNDAMYGEATGTFDTSLGTLKAVRVVSATTPGATPITGLNESYGEILTTDTYRIRIYDQYDQGSVTVVVALTYEYQTTGADSYKCIVLGTQANAIGASIASLSPGVARAEVEIGEIQNFTTTNYKVTIYASSDSPTSVDVDFAILSPLATNINMLKFAEAKFGVGSNNNLVFQKTSGTTTTGGAIIVPYAYYVVAQFEISDSTISAWYFFFDVNGVLLDYPYFYISTLNNVDTTISSVVITGEQDCDYIYITAKEGAVKNKLETPEWNKDTLFYIDFDDSSLNAGTLSENGSLGIALYRRYRTELSLLGIFPATTTSLTDYAIRSNETYSYELYYINTSGKYSQGMSSETICRAFRSVTLVEAIDNGDGSYTPINVWTFKNNIDTGSMSNNNSPKTLNNFTRYPLWQPSFPSPRSGTLMSLLSHFKDGEYEGDTVDDMNALYELSHSLNPLFYRDMKGNLFMVKTSAPISQAVDNKTEKRPVTVSVPWIETGDASKAIIITLG